MTIRYFVYDNHLWNQKDKGYELSEYRMLNGYIRILSDCSLILLQSMPASQADMDT
ncbi:hypothetical protein EZS27_028299 [termite gut metagenome]|uniref:Uncharacterized protein n=1 Tax=termite gut metagenome TaxID=433724 RepID=A0A5J4QJT5_9ZZZZ